MKLILRYMRERLGQIGVSVTAKILAAMGELMIPYILEYMIDRVVPRGELAPVIGWGLVMVAVALGVRQTNIFSNETAVKVARDCTENLRQDLFVRTCRLSGNQIDQFGLPSLISRMTSDSYNVQNFIANIQTIGIRAPILLVGGIVTTLTMDTALASILCVMAPILLCVVIFVSRKGIPMYDLVQQRLDTIVRVMRENITGIRVVKALSKKDYEKAAAARAEQERLEKEEEKEERRRKAEERARRIEEAKLNKGKKKKTEKKHDEDEDKIPGSVKEHSRVGLRQYARGRAYDPYRYSEEGPTAYPGEAPIFPPRSDSRALKREAHEIEEELREIHTDEAIEDAILEEKALEAPVQEETEVVSAGEESEAPYAEESEAEDDTDKTKE